MKTINDLFMRAERAAQLIFARRPKRRIFERRDMTKRAAVEIVESGAPITVRERVLFPRT